MTGDNRQSTAATYGVSVEDVVIIDGRPTIDGMDPSDWYEAMHESRPVNKHLIPIPGTTVAAWVNKSKYAPGYWSYSLFDGNGACIATDAVDFSGMDLTAEQVARLAFLLEVDYGERYGK